MAWAEENGMECYQEDSILYDPFDSVPFGYWLTNKGELVEIDSMTDSHLNNTIKMLNTKTHLLPKSVLGKLKELLIEARLRKCNA